MNELLKRKLPLHDFPVSNRRSTDQQTDGRTRPHLENNVTLRPDNGSDGSISHMMTEKLSQENNGATDRRTNQIHND